MQKIILAIVKIGGLDLFSCLLFACCCEYSTVFSYV
jgi:hypothetical protein